MRTVYIHKITDLYAPIDKLVKFYIALDEQKMEDLRHEQVMAKVLGYDAEAWLKYKKEQYGPAIHPAIKALDYRHITHKLRKSIRVGRNSY